jgi:hypothetical protein
MSIQNSTLCSSWSPAGADENSTPWSSWLSHREGYVTVSWPSRKTAVVYGPGPIGPGSLKPVEHSGTQPLISPPDGDGLTEAVVAMVGDSGEPDEAWVEPLHAVTSRRTAGSSRPDLAEVWAGAVTVHASLPAKVATNRFSVK